VGREGAAGGLIDESVMVTTGPILDIADVVKTYGIGELKVEALRGVSLSIDEGDFLIITGRNGSGKSTLLHQLGLLDKPDSGRILLTGQEVTTMEERQRSDLRLRTLGYIFQEFALVDELTALENVMLPAMMIGWTGSARQRALEMLTLVGLDGFKEHLPSQLSGGEQQKVAIARALVNDPVVLFADEPTANLDTIAAAEVLSIFSGLNTEHGRTIVMVTHEQEETGYGNRVIQLSDGKMVGDSGSSHGEAP
jgi:putative ABC transport system ATP-binding protein